MTAKKRVGRPRKGTEAAVKSGRGRPEFSPTAKMRKEVEILLGGGMSVEELARAFRMSKNTLKKHFADEIGSGRVKSRSAVILAMYEQAIGGSVTAQRAYIGLNDGGAAHELMGEAPSRQESEVRFPKLGKKEQRAIDADKAATDIYAVPPPPKMVTDTLQ